MLTRAAAVTLLAAAMACARSGDGGPDRITVDGQPVAVATLVEAHAALCQAASRPDEARALFFDRAHDPLHSVARALDGVDRPQAATLLEAKETVESALGAHGANPQDLLRLADVYRTSLTRLAITAPPCDK